MKKVLQKLHVMDEYGYLNDWAMAVGLALGALTVIIGVVFGLIVGSIYLERHFQRQECHNFSKAMDLETRARVLSTLGHVTCFVHTPSGVWINKDNYSANEVNLGGK